MGEWGWGRRNEHPLTSLSSGFLSPQPGPYDAGDHRVSESLYLVQCRGLDPKPAAEDTQDHTGLA